MANQALVDHGSDVADVVCAESLELAHDDIHDIENLYLEVLQGLVELNQRVTEGALRQEGQAPRYDVEVDLVPRVELRALAGELEETAFDVLCDVGRF